MQRNKLEIQYFFLVLLIKFFLFCGLILVFTKIIYDENSWSYLFFWQESIFYQALILGFFAQCIDGALGMAYGISGSAFLLANGIPPASASAAIHLAEVFTTGFSALAHIKHGNVDKRLFTFLSIFGIIGASSGALLLSNFHGNWFLPLINIYLLIMGFSIILRSFKKITLIKLPSKIYLIFIALCAGFLDSFGGGGWGAIVIVHLLNSNAHPRLLIGSSNCAEFFLTFFISVIFIISLPQLSQIWNLTLGLVSGGLLAAPVSARLLKFIPAKILMFLVGVLLVIISLINLILR